MNLPRRPDQGFYEWLLDTHHAADMFTELRTLVNSWGNWPRERRPSVILCAVVLVIYAQALVVRRGRWWNG